MERRHFRWAIIGGGILLFIFVAFLRKGESQTIATPPPTLDSPTPVSSHATQSQQNESTSVNVSVQPKDPIETTEIIHIVQPGETLFRISQKYDVDIQAIAQLNQILDPSQIMAGQEIKIPVSNDNGSAITAVSSTPQKESPPPTLSPVNADLTLNAVPYATIINLSPETRKHVDEIFARGQQLGRNPRAFSKLGDSTIMAPGLLVQFDQGAYNLGEFAYLQSVIDHFAGSFERYGAATHVGLHSWTVFDPMIADNAWCSGNEHIMACEFRLHNPSIIFIRLGSNDAGIPDSFDQHTRDAVQYAIDNGVIPIIGTKADRFEGQDNINNQILRQIAADYDVPLWDYDALANTLPNRGLDPSDNVHIDKATMAGDYTQSTTFQSGQAMQDLSALLMLEAIWSEINN